jgi:alpha-beta hydrolase superfamily lysophospholipase
MRVRWALMGALPMFAPGAASAEVLAPPTACPAELPAQTRCFAGQDAHGAYYWIAIPKAWNGSLVVHAHGGPSLKTPSQDEPAADLQRFAVTVKEGFAWAGSSYRHAGFGVRDAAADTDALRRIFWDRFGRPKHTLLHGQSWGANVAAKTAELYGRGADGRPAYDGVILTSGVLGGGTHSYDFRADLRVVYQYYCHNWPAADEPAYPLWQGLPADSKLKRKDLVERVNACTGVDLPPARRTPAQARALNNIVSVVRIPERTLVSHMEWASFTFRDLVQRQLGGANPFGNVGVRYAGSDDDAALNAGAQRFAADPVAVARLADDADLSGKLTVPTLTLHAKDDPTAFVELESAFHDTVARAGAESLLVQTFTDEHEHQKEATPEYAALFRSMLAWIERGAKPTPATVAAACETARTQYGEACHFDTGWRPPPLETRVYPRARPTS